jgi:hypothetical protein
MLTPASAPADKSSSSRGVREPIAPHRSVRRLPVTRISALSTVAVVALVEAAVIAYAQRGLDAMTAFARAIADSRGLAASATPERLAFLSPAPLSFAMRHSERTELIVVAIVCAAIAAAIPAAQWPAAPLRVFAVFNVLLVALAALVQLTGHGGYDSVGFTRLMLHTALCSWLVMPVFAGLLAALFPFNLLQRTLFVVAAVAYAVPLAIVSYGLFVAIAAAAGSLVISNLYVVFGPVIDALPVICLFSIFLARFDRALESGTRGLAWR